LGLIPATIGPYVCRSLGQRHARRYMISAETFDAHNALEMGLVHIVSAKIAHPCPSNRR